MVIEVRDSKHTQLLPHCIIKYEFNDQKRILKECSTGILQIDQVTFPIKFTVKALGYKEQVRTISLADVKVEKGGYRYTIFMDERIHEVNEIVVTGQSKPILASQSIYKVNVISNTQIAQRAANNLSEVLNYEMNNFISNDNILGSSVSMAGIGGQNVKILLNGIPLSGRENGNIDLGQLNLSNIKRVEMIQGPMSVVYGSNAMGGVVNLITQPPNASTRFNVRSYLESIGRYNINGSANFSKGKHSVQGSFARNFFSGWSAVDSLDRFQTWKPKTQYTADLQYNFDLNNKVKFNYYGSYLNEKISNKGQPIINSYEGYAFDEYYRTNRIINSVNGSIKVSDKESFNFTNSYTHYHRTKNRFKKDLVTLNQFETKSQGDQDTTIFKTFHHRGVLSSSRIKNTEALLGYEFLHETGQSFKLAEDTKTMKDLGIFSSINFSYKKISVQPSLRMTINSLYANGFTPAVHLMYNLSANSQLRASYANGYRVPSLKELYLQFIDQNHTIIGNSELKPEKGNHYELGLEKSFSIQDSKFCLTLNAMHNDIQDMIALAVYNSQGILRVYDNIERYRNWLANTQLKLNTTSIQTQVGIGYILVESSNIMPQHTIWEFNTAISYKIPKIKTSVNFNYKFNSKQPVLTVEENFLFTDPLHIANMSLQRKFFNNALVLQLGVKNLLNIQSSTLNGLSGAQGSAHTGATGMQLFPERSLFMDVQFSF